MPACRARPVFVEPELPEPKWSFHDAGSSHVYEYEQYMFANLACDVYAMRLFMTLSVTCEDPWYGFFGSLAAPSTMWLARWVRAALQPLRAL